MCSTTELHMQDNLSAKCTKRKGWGDAHRQQTCPGTSWGNICKGVELLFRCLSSSKLL